MNTIYEPTGAAREDSQLALTVPRGCPYGCRYCYCPGLTGASRAAWVQSRGPRPGLIEALAKFLGKNVVRGQVMLSFLGDCCSPSCIETTRQALRLLAEHGAPVAILTKTPRALLGDDALDALDDVTRFGSRIKILTTLTTLRDDVAGRWEQWAPLPIDRVDALARLHDAGIRTGVSVEPVLYPSDALTVIGRMIPHADEFLIGALSHMAGPCSIDWPEFVREALGMIREARRDVYVKRSIAKLLPRGMLRPEECDHDRLSVRSTAPTASAEQLDMFGA